MWTVLALLLISDFTTLSQQAGQAREANRLEQAVALYRQALALRPAWAEGWWYLGTVLYDRDDYAGAVGALEKVVALHPKNAEALVMLGLSEARLGRNQDALRHLRQGRPYLGKEGELRRVAAYNEAVLQLEAGAFGDAQKTLAALCREGLDERPLILALGSAVLAIPPSRVAPADQDLVWRAGWAEHFAAQRDRQPEALGEYRRLVADFPHARNVQFALGRVLLANHDDEEAIAAFQRELRNSPEHLLARLGIAGIQERLDPPAGLPYAEEAVRLYPKIAEGHYLLGLLLLDTGQTARSTTELEAAQRLTPEDARVYFALAKAYAGMHRNQDAARARAAFARLNNQSN